MANPDQIEAMMRNFPPERELLQMPARGYRNAPAEIHDAGPGRDQRLVELGLKAK